MMENSQYLISEYQKDKTTLDNLPWEKEIITPKKLSIFALSIFVIILTLINIGYKLNPTSFKITNQYYLLSALFQGVSAVFAIGITAILIGLQFLDNKYSYQSVKYLPEYVWGIRWYIVIYLSYLVSLLLLLLFINTNNILSPYYFLTLYFVIFFAVFILVYTWAKIRNIIRSLNYQLFFHLLTHNIFILDSKSKIDIKKNYEEIMDMFSEIINKSLKSQNENIAAHGIAALSAIFSSILIPPVTFDEENEEILGEIRSRYVRDVEIYINVASSMGNYKFLYVLLDCLLYISLKATIFIKTKENFRGSNLYPLISYFPEVIINKMKMIDGTIWINWYFIFTRSIIHILGFLKVVSTEKYDILEWKNISDMNEKEVLKINYKNLKPNYEVIDEVFVSFFKPLKKTIEEIKKAKEFKKGELLISEFLISQIIELGKKLAYVKKLENSLKDIVDTLKDYISFLCSSDEYSQKKGSDYIEIGLKEIFEICQKEKLEYCIRMKKEILKEMMKEIPENSTCKYVLHGIVN